MSLTDEQRAEIRRQNGRKSKGPKTVEGKHRSRANALKHGMRADVLALPNEDPAALAARTQAWNEYYQPQSPAAQHLLNECVRATVLADRCHTHHHAMLARQVREAADRWDAEQDLHLERLRALLPEDPAAAARRLKLCAAGCRWLIRRWEDLLGTLLRRGAWSGPDRDEAIRLLGLRPEADRLKESPAAYRLRLYNLLVSAEATEEALRWLLDPRLMPGSLRGTYDAGGLPEDEECRRWLSWTCEAQLEQLRDLEARLQSGIDGPDRAEAPARATILQEPAEARLFLRYHAKSRTAFHRHYAQLVKTLGISPK